MNDFLFLQSFGALFLIIKSVDANNEIYYTVHLDRVTYYAALQ